MRYFVSFISGSLFGLGLLVSGMTDTRRVQGWLDVFGRWDPTLAFVLGGAIVPMAFAWWISRRRTASFVGEQFPPPARTEISPNLIIGSILFGAGWGLAGLCPGPALASLSFGGAEGLIFLAAMLAGMALARPLRLRAAKIA